MKAILCAFMVAISILLSNVALAEERLTADQMDAVTAGYNPYYIGNMYLNDLYRYGSMAGSYAGSTMYSLGHYSAYDSSVFWSPNYIYYYYYY
jgi:hypothetical protein